MTKESVSKLLELLRYVIVAVLSWLANDSAHAIGLLS